MQQFQVKMSLNNSNRGRLLRDMGDIVNCSIPGIILTDWDETAYNKFKVVVAGPANTPFESGSFEVSFHVPARFPFSAPNVQFLTPVFHPNIFYDGVICVDILSEWCAATTLLEVAECLQALLAAPNPTSPINVDAALLMDVDIQMYDDTVRMWTAVHAGGIHRPPCFQDKLRQVLEFSPVWSEDRALRKLSENNWDVAKTLQSRRAY